MNLKKPLFLAVYITFFMSPSVGFASKVDAESFFSTCESKFPKHLFKGKYRKSFEDIFKYWEGTAYTDNRWLAYILATAYRESAGTMQPVREGLCKTDQCSIDKITAYFEKKNRPQHDNYALPDKYGRSYFGRGLVQLTHKRNYKRVGEAIGMGDKLVENPDLALDNGVSIKVLVEGSAQGLFVKNRKTKQWRKLSDYFNEDKSDWHGARKIINPGSKRAHIPAKHGQKFFACLESPDRGSVNPPPLGGG